MGRPAALALASMIKSGACVNLEKLILDQKWVGQDEGADDAADKGVWSNQGAVDVLEALQVGCTPALHSLDMCGAKLTSTTGVTSLLAAISDCTNLERLNLTCGFRNARASLHFLQGTSQGMMMPSLAHLDTLFLGYSFMDQEHGQLLAQGLGKGAFGRVLRRLHLSGNKNMGDRGLVPLLESLAEGACPRLEALELANVGMGTQGIVAMAKALSSGTLQHLDYLDISTVRRYCDREGFYDDVLVVIREGRCPALTTIYGPAKEEVVDAMRKGRGKIKETR